jgi:hypothetical protein
MFTLLGKIRRRLFKKDKFRQYLPYAVGEIFLVVIGILIAIQINNWNDDRIRERDKNKLLASLQVDFQQNLNQLDTVMYYDNLVMASSFEFLDIRVGDTILTNSQYMRELLQNTSWNWTYDPLNGALRSGISSGVINSIRNDSLISALFSWQDVVADAKENEERSLTTRLAAKSVIEKHVRNVDYRSTDRTEMGDSKFPSDYAGLVSDPLFEDYISDRYARMRDAVLELRTVRELNVNILRMIESELSD